MLQGKAQKGQAHLPEELLVSILSALDHPRHLLACVSVCKAWSTGADKALLPKLDLKRKDLGWLTQVLPVQLAAVREVRMLSRLELSAWADEVQRRSYLEAMRMDILQFIYQEIPMLQQLALNWEDAPLLGSHLGEERAYGRHICETLPRSLHTVELLHVSVSLPHLGHLTGLTKLRLLYSELMPAQEQLPPLPALRHFECCACSWRVAPTWSFAPKLHYPGPQDLGLASSLPLLTKVTLLLDGDCVSQPKEQLATLADMTQLETIELHFCEAQNALPLDTLLSLPRSATKLVLWNFPRDCVPAVVLPENIIIVHNIRP